MRAISILLVFISLSVNSQETSSQSADSVINFIEAKFPGGDSALIQFIDDNLIYPKVARMMGNQGLVIVSFIVDVNGEIKNIALEKSNTEELDHEAKRIISIMPPWIPAQLGEDRVESKCILPISFVLENKKSKKRSSN